MRISPHAFHLLGQDIMNRRPKRDSMVATLEDQRDFRAMFGPCPLICSVVWEIIDKPPKGLPKHLLWALMFLKLYETNSTLAAMAKTTRPTFRKWSWLFVEAIALQESRVVSFVVLCIICCIKTCICSL